MTGRFVAIALLSLLPLDAPSAGQTPPTNPDAQTMADFTKRVEAYTDLRKKLERDGAKLEETKDAAKIKAAQEALAQRMRAARAGARRGDIFTPETVALFRRLMYPEVKGPDAAVTKKAIKDDAPPKPIKLAINAAYPEGAPLPTVPPNLLMRLPKLPDDLEYRVVHTDLILRDGRANIIVDYIPGAIR
jgi:hypothetical protein